MQFWILISNLHSGQKSAKIFQLESHHDFKSYEKLSSNVFQYLLISSKIFQYLPISSDILWYLLIRSNTKLQKEIIQKKSHPSFEYDLNKVNRQMITFFLERMKTSLKRREVAPLYYYTGYERVAKNSFPLKRKKVSKGIENVLTLNWKDNFCRWRFATQFVGGFASEFGVVVFSSGQEWVGVARISAWSCITRVDF